jgi:hypothetical protein
MKNLRIASFLLAVAVSGSASAQSSGNSPERPSPGVTQAHCQYTPDDPACQHHAPPNRAPGQCRRPTPCPSPCCPYDYPPPYRPPWLFEPENGTHAAAGALVGFGIGAIAGAAHDGDSGTRLASALMVGTLGALIGTAVGHGIPARHWRRHHRVWDDPDENAASPGPDPAAAHTPSSWKTAASQPSGP